MKKARTRARRGPAGRARLHRRRRRLSSHRRAIALPSLRRVVPASIELTLNAEPFAGWTKEWDRMEELIALSEITLNRKLL